MELGYEVTIRRERTLVSTATIWVSQEEENIEKAIRDAKSSVIDHNNGNWVTQQNEPDNITVTCCNRKSDL